MKAFERLIGVLTVVGLPWAMSPAGLRRLMADPSPCHRREPEPAIAISSAGFALRILSRLRLPFWRNTCLFRAAMCTQILRRSGRPAVLRIGAARDPTEDSEVIAHAWVEVEGEPVTEEGGRYKQFSLAGDSAAR